MPSYVAKKAIKNGGIVTPQCTFWCPALSDPAAAWIASTPVWSQCTDMTPISEKIEVVLSQCTFWCSVLSDDGVLGLRTSHIQSQCTFWCSVLSD